MRSSAVPDPASLLFGVNTFGDVTAREDGSARSHASVIRDVVREAEIAEAVGLDVFSVGEHHRPDFAISSPATLLAAIAGRTRRIRLGSGVTVLSSDDPVRVFQCFSTLAAVSDGRAEVIAGRGSFTESFPLFGASVSDYTVLFEEKLDLLVALLRRDEVTWSGRTRSALQGARVVPVAEPGALALWVGAGGSPESVVRAARHDLPLMLAIIGGDPARFAPLVALSRRARAELGFGDRALGIHSPGFVADTDEEARAVFHAPYTAMIDRIGAERGWPPLGRAHYEAEIETGSLYVGSPDTVARRIATTARVLGINRFDLKYSAGTLPHARLARSIELFGRRVVPLVRDMLSGGDGG